MARGNEPLPRQEVFDAEAVGALKGLQQAMAYLGAEFANDIYICLDNLEVAGCLRGPITTASQQIFSDFTTLA